jgi:enoyl-CoA hydratase/carnithine racemase
MVDGQSRRHKSALARVADGLSGGSGLRFRESDGIATLVFDRVEVLNAINDCTFRDLGSRLELLAADQRIKVVVLCGAGAHFSSGADIKEPIPSAATLLATPIERHPAALLYRFAAPTVAAIRGYCLGGGLELALATDIRIAAQSAIFGFPEIEWGLTTGWGGSVLLKRVIGRSLALDLIMTARRIDAAEALRIGLVHRVVADRSFEDVVQELSNKLRDAPSEAVRGVKRLLADENFEAELKAEVETFAAVAHSEEARRRLRGFGGRVDPDQ